MLVDVKASHNSLSIWAHGVDIATSKPVSEVESWSHEPKTRICFVAKENGPDPVVLPALQKAVHVVLSYLQ